MLQALRGGRLQSWDGRAVPGHGRQNLEQKSVRVAVINLVPASSPAHFLSRVRALSPSGDGYCSFNFVITAPAPPAPRLPSAPPSPPAPRSATAALVGFWSVESKVWVDFRSSFFSPSLTFPSSSNLFSGLRSSVPVRAPFSLLLALVMPLFGGTVAWWS